MDRKELMKVGMLLGVFLRCREGRGLDSEGFLYMWVLREWGEVELWWDEFDGFLDEKDLDGRKAAGYV